MLSPNKLNTTGSLLHDLYPILNLEGVSKAEKVRRLINANAILHLEDADVMVEYGVPKITLLAKLCRLTKGSLKQSINNGTRASFHFTHPRYQNVDRYHERIIQDGIKLVIAALTELLNNSVYAGTDLAKIQEYLHEANPKTGDTAFTYLKKAGVASRIALVEKLIPETWLDQDEEQETGQEAVSPTSLTSLNGETDDDDDSDDESETSQRKSARKSTNNLRRKRSAAFTIPQRAKINSSTIPQKLTLVRTLIQRNTALFNALLTSGILNIDAVDIVQELVVKYKKLRVAPEASAKKLSDEQLELCRELPKEALALLRTGISLQTIMLGADSQAAGQYKDDTEQAAQDEAWLENFMQKHAAKKQPPQPRTASIYYDSDPSESDDEDETEKEADTGEMRIEPVQNHDQRFFPEPPAKPDLVVRGFSFGKAI